MDRDKNWDRTNVAFECMAFAKGKIFKSAKEAIENSYQNNITDEFLKPCVIEGFNGIQKNDAVICLNFRPDRARQITRKFTEEKRVFRGSGIYHKLGFRTPVFSCGYRSIQSPPRGAEALV